MSGEKNEKKTWVDEVDFKKISCHDHQGFGTFYRVEELAGDAEMLARIPHKNGVYLILFPADGEPGYNGGDTETFGLNEQEPKGTDKLEKAWVKGTRVIYIGKAGVLNGKGASNLYTRIREYLKWYKGARNSHHGGRDIWQLNDPGKLLVTWRVTEDEDPRSCEKALLKRFDEMFREEQKISGKGKKKKCLPFANHQS